MNTKVTVSNDKTHTFIITLDEAEILVAKKTALAKLAKNVKLAGFRSGKAPLEMIENKISKEVLNREVITIALTDAGNKVIESSGELPLTKPNVDMKEFEAYTKLIGELTFATKPDSKIGDYKKAIKKALADKEDKTIPLSDEQLLDAATSVLKCEYSPLFIEQEVNTRMEELIRALEKSKITLQAFLSFSNKTIDELLTEKREEAKKLIEADFTFVALADDMKITVTDADVEEFAAKDENAMIRPHLEKEHSRLYVKNVLTKQKVLDALGEIAKGLGDNK